MGVGGLGMKVGTWQPYRISQPWERPFAPPSPRGHVPLQPQRQACCTGIPSTLTG